MSDEKEKDKQEMQDQSNEIVGLDEEVDEAKSESSENSLMGKLGNLKKFLIPGGIAVGASALTIIVFLLFSGDPKSESESATNEETPVEQVETAHGSTDNQSDNNIKNHQTETVDQHVSSNAGAHENVNPVREETPYEDERPSDRYLDSIAKINFEPVDFSKYEDIDTMKIMEELNFLYTTPEDEFAEDGLTPEDSVDTLNWLEARMLELTNKEKELESREKSIKKLDSRVQTGLKKINQAESSRITGLARLYDGMKPNEVAKLFANLSDEVVISLIPRMKPAHAAKIMALIPSKRAAKLSTQMITVLEE